MAVELHHSLAIRLLEHLGIEGRASPKDMEFEWSRAEAA